MMVLNLTRSSVVVQNLRVAQNLWERMRGLIGTEPLQIGEGFLIPHCQGIHTFGMTYRIDLIYLDREGKVVALFEELEPNQLGPIRFQTHSILELPVGAITRSGTHIGDLLNLDSLEVLALTRANGVPTPFSLQCL